MKTRYLENFLFPSGSLDFSGRDLLFPQGNLSGVGGLSGTVRVIDFNTAVAGATSYGVYVSGMSAAEIAAALNALVNPPGSITFEVQEPVSTPAAPAPAPAPAPAATAPAPAAAPAAVRASNISSMTLDVNSSGPFLWVNYLDGTDMLVAVGDEIDPWLASRGYTRANAGKTGAYARWIATQTAAVDTSTQTVQHTDSVSGTVSTGNTATGTVTVTTPSGQTAAGTGSVTAGGVTTTANPATGTVTTTNHTTGVTTTTSGSTGSTVQTVTAASGGTGNIALYALLGLLLLRGALK